MQPNSKKHGAKKGKSVKKTGKIFAPAFCVKEKKKGEKELGRQKSAFGASAGGKGGGKKRAGGKKSTSVLPKELLYKSSGRRHFTQQRGTSTRQGEGRKNWRWREVRDPQHYGSNGAGKKKKVAGWGGGGENSPDRTGLVIEEGGGKKRKRG